MQLSSGTLAGVSSGVTRQSQLFVTPPPWWPTVLPSPELTAAILVSTLVAAVVAVVVIVRIVVPNGVRIARTLRRIWKRITPKSTFGKVMVISALLFVVATAPTMLAAINSKQAVQEIGTGTTIVAEMDDDTIESWRAPTAGSDSDRDGDGLPDSWERQGETPEGIPLPNANPDRKDVYLQVLYGANITPLSDSERATLRGIWANMPVQNPDGSTGISLHIVDERRLDGSVRLYEPSKEFLYARYDDDHLQGGTCVYYQTTFGELTESRAAGHSALGGHVSLIDATETTVRNGRSDRVVFLTHGLLHNTAGRVDGDRHTASGWLAPTYDGSELTLSAVTAAELESGFASGPSDRRCRRA